MLKAIARIVKDVLRSSDIPARYCGDEFAIILPETGNQTRVLEKLNETEILVADDKLKLSACIGIVSAESAGLATSREMIRSADSRLYTAKNRGTGIICDR